MRTFRRRHMAHISFPKSVIQTCCYVERVSFATLTGIQNVAAWVYSHTLCLDSVTSNYTHCWDLPHNTQTNTHTRGALIDWLVVIVLSWLECKCGGFVGCCGCFPSQQSPLRSVPIHPMGSTLPMGTETDQMRVMRMVLFQLHIRNNNSIPWKTARQQHWRCSSCKGMLARILRRDLSSSSTGSEVMGDEWIRD